MNPMDEEVPCIESTCDLSRVICKQCKQKVCIQRIGEKDDYFLYEETLRIKNKPLYKEMLKSEESKKGQKHLNLKSATCDIKTKSHQLSIYESMTKTECWDINDKKSKVIHKAIGEMICVDNEPYNLVERTGFKKLMEIVKPQYKVPGRKYFTDNIIPEMYVELKLKIMDMLKQVHTVSLTSDIWTCSHNNESFLSFTCHWISNDMIQHHCVLNVRHFSERHIGLAIKDTLERLLQEWDLEKKIHLLVRDNGVSIKKGVDDASLCSSGCFLHTIHLLVTESIKSQKSVQDLMIRARKVSTHFHHSSSATDKLKSIQIELGTHPKKLIQDICTRWNSSFYMLKRLLQLKTAILVYISDVESTLPTFSPNDWLLMESLIHLLKSFEELTKRISSNKSIISEVIPAIMILDTFLNRPNTSHFGVGTTKDIILTRFSKRFEKIIKDDNLIIATFLDPSYISAVENLNAGNRESLWDFNKEIATTSNIDQTEEPKSLNYTDLDDYHNFNKDLVVEFEKYCNMKCVSIEEDPLSWWKINFESFPLIGNKLLLQKYLSAPASSVYSERSFSEAGLVKK
ncbi:zinc finger BED domain-containing protein 4-like [Metopolophium dirhodum]|uniref:zinc finger BED domain-containing protein 4-like n=1 Tax=Metopolophium dirhodum TaxID=44670 RepID=UPI0029902FD3|nr:zinc finger BED domain-containing protein 4-like [Metopolophium dirhodum]